MRTELVLIFFIGIGILLRILGLNWGIPDVLLPECTAQRSSFHLDEDKYLQSVSRMNSEGFRIDDFHLGTLQFYLIAAALRVSESAGYLTRPWQHAFLQWDPQNFPRVYQVGRMISAIAGILSLLVTYLIGEKMRDNETGLAAAAFLSVAPLHVVNSHFLTSDVTMVLLLLIAFYFFLATLDGGRMLTSVASGFFLGLAISAKYNAAYLLPLWVGRDLLLGKESQKKNLPAYGAMILGFAAGEPYAFVRPMVFLGTIYRAHFVTTEAMSLYLLPWSQLVLEQYKALLNYGLQWGLAGAGALGFLYCVLSGSRTGISLAAAIMLMTVSLAGAKWPMIRYCLPLVPLFALAAALLVGMVARQKSYRLGIYVLLASWSLVFSWAQVRILRRDHAANACARWVNSHVVEGSSISQIWPAIPVLNGRRYRLRTLRGIFRHDGEEDIHLDSDYLILDNLPIASFKESFSHRLADEFIAVAEFRFEPRLGPLAIPEPQPPHDWKYTHPVITVYKRR